MEILLYIIQTTNPTDLFKNYEDLGFKSITVSFIVILLLALYYKEKQVATLNKESKEDLKKSTELTIKQNEKFVEYTTTIKEILNTYMRDGRNN